MPSCQFHMCPGRGSGRSNPVCPARIGPSLGDQRQRLGDQLGLLVGDPLHRAPLARLVAHPPAQPAVRLERDQRRLVGPVLHQLAVQPTRGVAGQPVEHRPVVGPQPREHRHVVRAQEDVDRIELEQPEPLDQRHDLPRARTRRASRPGGAGRTPGRRALFGGRPAPRSVAASAYCAADGGGNDRADGGAGGCVGVSCASASAELRGPSVELRLLLRRRPRPCRW